MQDFLQVRCPSCHPTNSVKALKNTVECITAIEFRKPVNILQSNANFQHYSSTFLVFWLVVYNPWKKLLLNELTEWQALTRYMCTETGTIKWGLLREIRSQFFLMTNGVWPLWCWCYGNNKQVVSAAATTCPRPLQMVTWTATRIFQLGGHRVCRWCGSSYSIRIPSLKFVSLPIPKI